MDSADTTDPVARAQALADQVSAQARRTEQQRCLPAALAGQLRQAGLFGLTTPRAYGGLEADPRTIVATVAELSRADAATGWTVAAGQGGGYLAWLEPETAAGIVARTPHPVIAGSTAPRGQVAGGDGDQLRVTGRWPYATGCRLAHLLFGVCRTGSDPDARLRFALFAPEQAQIHDTWRAIGLRGCGSHDVSVRDLPVPQSRTFDLSAPARQPGALYRLPWLTGVLVTLAGFPLGVARRVLDEYTTVAQHKQTVERTLLSETPFARQDLAEWESAVTAARAGVLLALDDLWNEALDGVPAPGTQARFTGAVQHALRTAVTVADAALRGAGAGQLFSGAPLQRCFRDVQAAAQHPAFGTTARQRVGAALFGHAVPTALI